MNVIENKGNKNLKIAFMGTEEYREALQQEALNRKTKVQGLLEDAVAAYVAKPAEPGKPAIAAKPEAYPYKAENKTLHDRLEKILNSGDEATIRAVVPNIDIFFERLKPPPKKASSKPAGL